MGVSLVINETVSEHETNVRDEVMRVGIEAGFTAETAIDGSEVHGVANEAGIIRDIEGNLKMKQMKEIRER